MRKKLSNLRNPKILKRLIAATIVVLAISGYLFYVLKTGRVSIDDSLVYAPIINIAPTSQGKLLETDVYENQSVKKGDLLAIVGSEGLHADSDGLVVMANKQIGSLVNPQMPVVQIINIPDMRIAGTIDENKGLKDVKIGQVASFTVDAFPGKTYWGYVDEISPSAKQTQLSFSISSERPTQQFVVYVKYNGANYPEIKNGMSAKLTIFTDTKDRKSTRLNSSHRL